MTDPQERREFEKQKAKNYTPEIISALASKFQIKDRVQIAALQEFLIFAAWQYHNLKNEATKKPTLRSLRAEIREIQKVAIALNTKLESLSKSADELFWAPQRRILSDVYFMNDPVSPFGHQIIRHQPNPNDPSKVSIQILQEWQIREAVGIVSNLAQHALDIKFKVEGRPSDEALRMWVVNIQQFWEKVLERPFTYDGHKGEGVTPAFDFCREALNPLDHVTGSGAGDGDAQSNQAQ